MQMHTEVAALNEHVGSTTPQGNCLGEALQQASHLKDTSCYGRGLCVRTACAAVGHGSWSVRRCHPTLRAHARAAPSGAGTHDSEADVVRQQLLCHEHMAKSGPHYSPQV